MLLRINGYKICKSTFGIAGGEGVLDRHLGREVRLGRSNPAGVIGIVGGGGGGT